MAWKLPSGELEALMRLLASASDEGVASLSRQALRGPSDAEVWGQELRLRVQLVEVATESRTSHHMFAYVTL